MTPSPLDYAKYLVPFIILNWDLGTDTFYFPIDHIEFSLQEARTDPRAWVGEENTRFMRSLNRILAQTEIGFMIESIEWDALEYYEKENYEETYFSDFRIQVNLKEK